MTREQRTASQLPKSSNQSEFQKSAAYMVVHIIFHHLPSWNEIPYPCNGAEKYLPAMLAIDVRASSFCARETRGTKAKFNTFAETFFQGGGGSAAKTWKPWENNVKLHTLMAWKRHGSIFMIATIRSESYEGIFARHVSFFYPATSLAYAYAVVWSHFEGNLTKWHVIPIQNTTTSMFLKGQLCRINFGLSQGSQKLFCAIHVPEAD